MNDLQNKPGVTIALIAVLVGALVVTFVRIRGNLAVAGGRSVAQEQQASAQPKHAVPTDDVPPVRDPFGHAILSTRPTDDVKVADQMPGAPPPAGRPLPTLPFGIEDVKTHDVHVNSPQPSGKSVEPPLPVAGSPKTEAPAFKLQAVISGSNPLAVIKDGAGKTHFVHEGDQLGDGAVVAKIVNGTVAIRYGGSFSVLSLERGSGGNEETQ